MANQVLRITIEDDNSGGYKTGIDNDKLRTKKANNITWFFDAPLGFPNDSTLFLNFFTKDASGAKVDAAGPMQGSDWTAGFGSAGVNGRRIRGNVKNTALDSYSYLIGYREVGGADHVLMDPEIIVEGNLPEDVPGGKGGKRKTRAGKRKAAKKSAAAGRKKAAKKSAKKKSGKKAKKAKTARKAKTAKRSTQRKAKKAKKAKKR